MSYKHEDIEYKGHNIVIENDDNPSNPRDDDNICVIHTAHRNYAFGDKNYKDLESINEANRKAHLNGDIVLPLYMYEHSGITISLGQFSCPWDSGQVGFVQIPRKKMIEEFGKKNFTKKLKEKAHEWAKIEVEILDNYLRGEVYGYVVDDGDESCWGYYSIEDAMTDAKSVVDWIVEKEKKDHFQQLKIWIKNKVPLSIRTSLANAL